MTRFVRKHESVLLLVLVLECAIFGVAGTNFLTTPNAFEITRLSVEIGLIALALTPVIITGGIDLSVGSMMGLTAVRCINQANPIMAITRMKSCAGIIPPT